MEQKKTKIYPYLIDSKRMIGYYELLLDDDYQIKLFNKKEDKAVYDYFLPSIRDYLFWSFDMNLSSEIKEYEKLKNDIKATICATYTCNVFEKEKTKVVCFGTGICFAITDDKKVVEEKELGEKKLAYPIKNELNGYYFVYEVEATKEVIAEFDRKAGLDESVLRHLIIKLDEE